MKPEKEMLWVVLLYNSPHTKDPANLRIFAKPGCKRDFERIVGASESNKDFYEWITKLIEFKILEPTGKLTIGSRNNVVTDGYIVIASKLEEYAKRNLSDLFVSYLKFFTRGTINI